MWCVTDPRRPSFGGPGDDVATDVIPIWMALVQVIYEASLPRVSFWIIQRHIRVLVNALSQDPDGLPLPQRKHISSGMTRGRSLPPTLRRGRCFYQNARLRAGEPPRGSLPFLARKRL